MSTIEEAPGPMAKCQYCRQPVFGYESWHDYCRIQGLEKELAAAQTKLRAQEGLTRIAEKERDQFKDKLSRFETAKMPERPHGLDIRAGIVSYDYAVVQEYAIALETFAAAQTVRAEENERGAAYWRQLQQTTHNDLTLAILQSRRKVAAAIRGQKS